MLSQALRSAILAASRNSTVERLVGGAPVSRNVVRRFVAGEGVDDAVRASRELTGKGLTVSLDHLGEDTLDAGQADATVKAYLVLLERLSEAGLTAGGRTEVSVKLSAVGQTIDDELALEGARAICSAADAAGTTVTLDMEDHTTTDRTLATLHTLRRDFPSTGAVLQAYLHRTEDDCRALAVEGSRVRLCKGAYKEPASVAYQSAQEVDASYVRCLKVLMAGPGYPMVATHDPRLVAITGELARHRVAGTYEYQMLYGIRPHEQERLAAQGDTVRVYVPYGDQWYGYLMRRLAERPANLAFFLRALASKR
jgi:proline dehydrogenase